MFSGLVWPFHQQASFSILQLIPITAPSFEADVDDTAKAISCLNVLGRPVSPESMIQTFEADTHFRTYAGERDPSCTANSNALLALLHQPDVSLYSNQILKITKFLCDYWWTSDGRIEDKWVCCRMCRKILIYELTMIHRTSVTSIHLSS